MTKLFFFNPCRSSQPTTAIFDVTNPRTQLVYGQRLTSDGFTLARFWPRFLDADALTQMWDIARSATSDLTEDVDTYVNSDEFEVTTPFALDSKLYFWDDDRVAELVPEAYLREMRGCGARTTAEPRERK